jgi:hypothetical protein
VRTSGTERPIRRPKDAQQQKEAYSGKKKRPTKKHVTLTHPTPQYILAASQEAQGSKHEKKIFDEAALSCTTPIPISADSGFQGLEVGQAVVIPPIKGKRKKKGEPGEELTRAQQRTGQNAYQH